MSADINSLLTDAEMSAERSIAYVRCAIGVAVSIFYFGIVAPTLVPESPALRLVPYFMAFCVGFFIFGAASFFFTRANRFRNWMTWLFTTLDLCFWCGLLAATVLIIELPKNYIVVVPPALIVFVMLALVALRNNPWLQAYAMAFVVVAFVGVYLLAETPITAPGKDLGTGIGFFDRPFNVVRLLIIALTGMILTSLAVRTRRLLNRAVRETVQRTNLSRYLPPQLAGRLAQVDQDHLLSGRLQEAAVLFVDIRGFTTIAEGMEPETLRRFLSRYRRIVSAEVHAHDGIVDKFVGDSVMAVFGAPDSRGGADAANALSCATGIVKSIAEWNAESGRTHGAGIAVGVGAHWGEVFCGAVGDSDRLEFTVLGDTVNVAARLERQTKEVGALIVASQPLFAKAALQPVERGWVAVSESQIRGRRGRLQLFAYS